MATSQQWPWYDGIFGGNRSSNTLWPLMLRFMLRIPPTPQSHGGSDGIIAVIAVMSPGTRAILKKSLVTPWYWWQSFCYNCLNASCWWWLDEVLNGMNGLNGLNGEWYNWNDSFESLKLDSAKPAVICRIGDRICQIWVQKAMEENFLQGDEEKLLELPVQSLYDREKANLPYGQIGFIEYLVAPFLLTVTKVRCKLQNLQNLQTLEGIHFDFQTEMTMRVCSVFQYVSTRSSILSPCFSL